MGMTVEQRKALALATARGRLSNPKSAVEKYFAANAGIETEPEEASFTESVGRGMMDVYQGGKQLALNAFGDQETADSYNAQVSEELGLFNKNNPDILSMQGAGRILGNIATPLSLLPGAAGTGAARAASVPAMGGLFGAMQPVQDVDNFAGQKAEQIGVGAALSPVLPLLGKGAGKIGLAIENAVAPLSAKGRTASIEALLSHQANKDSGGFDKIVSALQEPSNGRTTAQMIAAANRGSSSDFGAPLVRLEKDLAQEGIAGEALRSQYAKQAAGRKSVIDGIAGTEARMRDAVNRRAYAADPYYQVVSDSVNEVDVGNIRSYIKDVIKRNPNELGVTGPLKWINNRLRFKDPKKPQGELSPGAMHSLSKQIKVMANKKNAAGQSEYNKTVLSAVKDQLDKSIGETEEAFSLAQKAYAEGSRPINQMQVGKELAYALESALENETPASLTNAIRNAPQTIKRATKIGAYENLSDILSPKQVQDVENVVTELINQKHQSMMERSVRPIFSEIKTGLEPRLPRILERSVVIANHALKKLSIDKSDAYHKEIIGMLMEPESLVQILRRPSDDKTRKIAMEIVSRLSSQVPAQTVSREVGSD